MLEAKQAALKEQLCSLKQDPAKTFPPNVNKSDSSPNFTAPSSQDSVASSVASRKIATRSVASLTNTIQKSSQATCYNNDKAPNPSVKENASEVTSKNPVSGTDLYRANNKDEDLFSSAADNNCVPVTETKTKDDVQSNIKSTSNPTSSRETKKLVLICTGLSTSESLLVHRLVKSLQGNTHHSAQLLPSWTPMVTHVIVKCDEDGTTDRTLKYLYGVASGCWVVNVEWVKQCLERGKILPETEYESLDSTGYRGPQRARLKCRQLLKDCTICYQPPFRDVSLPQLQELVKLCGGELATLDQLSSLSVPDATKHQLQLIVIQADEDDADVRPLAQDLCDKYGRVVVACDWFIECVGMYSLVALAPYLLSQPTEQQLRNSGVSLELLQDTQDFV